MVRAGLIVVAVLASGCATFGMRLDGARLTHMRADAEQRGLELADPLEIDTEMRNTMFREVGMQGTELERLQRLSRWLRSKEGLGFTYDINATRTAREAFYARSGDCLSYAHLVNALARYVGVSMGYVRYREATGYDERNGQFTVVSHVASVFSNYRMTVLVELNGVPESYRVSDYENVGDDEAAALHASNLAMEQFAHGERREPEAMLRWLVERTPNLPEVHSNLAAVLLRRGKNEEAMGVLNGALERFPDFVPLYVNGSLAARRLGDEVRSEELAEKARSKDPFVPFVKGTWLLEKGKYAAAEALLKSARRMRPQSVMFTAWLAKAQLLGGKEDEGKAMFAQARKLAPTHPLVLQMEQKDPRLQPVESVDRLLP